MAIESTKTTEICYEGCVLAVYRQDYRAMSDVYTYAEFATVWSFSQNKPVKVLVNAMFECDQSGRFATVDATETVKELHKAYVEAQELKRQNNLRKQAQIEAEKAARAPTKGRMVEVVKGRKVAIGTTGFVFWSGHDNYGNLKIGIATSPEKRAVPGKKYASFTNVVFTAASNCVALADQTQAANYTNQ